MALVTVQRSPSPSNTPETVSSDLGDGLDTGSSLKSPNRSRSFSESYSTFKGAALILPQSECMRTVTRASYGGDIQNHLQSMFHVLRPQDTIKVAVKLESAYQNRKRYFAVVSTMGRQDEEESIILGIDISEDIASIGLVRPIWCGSQTKLDGDGGFSFTYDQKKNIFKPISVQAMWSALQTLSRVQKTSDRHNYHPNGLTHTWMSYYEVNIKSDQSCLNEWNFMEDIVSARIDPELVTKSEEELQFDKLIKSKLREIMMSVDLEEVTSKTLRTKMEEDLQMNLREFRQDIDEEMIVILRQMDSASEIFDFLYLGSEWNASNLEELKDNGIGYILNITREIDNFFPGIFQYYNIRVYDVEKTDLLKHWDNTYKFICMAREKNSKVLVHCKMGISRSASTVIAFAMKDYGWSLEEAFKYVKEKRNVTRPNVGFMQQLETYEGILDASKQRHSSLWKSKSTSDLSTPITEEQEAEDDTKDTNLFNEQGRPRSWSPDDSPAEILLKATQMAPDSDSSGEEAHGAYGYSDEVFGDSITDFYSKEWDSSHSTDSLDDVFPKFTAEESQEKASCRSVKSDKPVVLLSHTPYNIDLEKPLVIVEETVEEQEEGYLEEEEPSSRIYQGFYDVSMLCGSCSIKVSSLQELPDMDRLQILECIHPDVKIESWMTQMRKHRRTAQILKLSDKKLIEETLAAKEMKAAQLATKMPSKIPPLSTKLRPDESWIKDEVDMVVDIEQEERRTSGSDHDTTNERSSSIASADTDTTTASPSHDKACSHFEKEDISWNPGTVKKTTKDIELKIQSGLTVQDIQTHLRHLSASSGSGCGSLEGSADKADELLASPDGDKQRLDSLSLPGSPMKKSFQSTDSGGNDSDVFEDGKSKRPASIYETEDIELEPGLVQRKKQEFESRERSCSMIDGILDKSWLKPVQRSSSFKTERTSKKNRNSERRKTCLPVLRASLFQDLIGEKDDPLRQRAVSEPPPLSPGTEVTDSDSQVRLLMIGNDEIQIEEGKVKRQTQDFEMKQDPLPPSQEIIQITPSAPPAPQTPVEKERRHSQFMEEGVEIVTGSVKRQKAEIEQKYGSGERFSGNLDLEITVHSEDGENSSLQNEYPSLLSPEEKSAVLKKVASTSDLFQEKNSEDPIDDKNKTTESHDLYQKEDISWSIGTVKQHTKALENMTKEADPSLKMTQETLGLISKIGQCLLESNGETVRSTETLKGVGRVKKVTKRIEHLHDKGEVNPKEKGSDSYGGEADRLNVVQKRESSDKKNTKVVNQSVDSSGKVLTRGSTPVVNTSPQSDLTRGTDVKQTIPQQKVSKSENTKYIQESHTKGASLLTQKSGDGGLVECKKVSEATLSSQTKEESDDVNKETKGKRDMMKIKAEKRPSIGSKIELAKSKLLGTDGAESKSSKDIVSLSDSVSTSSGKKASLKENKAESVSTKVKYGKETSTKEESGKINTVKESSATSVEGKASGSSSTDTKKMGKIASADVSKPDKLGLAGKEGNSKVIVKKQDTGGITKTEDVKRSSSTTPTSVLAHKLPCDISERDTRIVSKSHQTTHSSTVIKTQAEESSQQKITGQKSMSSVSESLRRKRSESDTSVGNEPDKTKAENRKSTYSDSSQGSENKVKSLKSMFESGDKQNQVNKATGGVPASDVAIEKESKDGEGKVKASVKKTVQHTVSADPQISKNEAGSRSGIQRTQSADQTGSNTQYVTEENDQSKTNTIEKNKVPLTSVSTTRIPKLLPINVQEREPDHPEAARKNRKLHGKSHPLYKLAGDPQLQGRNTNPFYNTM